MVLKMTWGLETIGEKSNIQKIVQPTINKGTRSQISLLTLKSGWEFWNKFKVEVDVPNILK